MHFEFAYFFFFVIHLELKRQLGQEPVHTFPS